MSPELTQDLVEGVWHTLGSTYKKFAFSLTLGSLFGISALIFKVLGILNGSERLSAVCEWMES